MCECVCACVCVCVCVCVHMQRFGCSYTLPLSQSDCGRSRHIFVCLLGVHINKAGEIREQDQELEQEHLFAIKTNGATKHKNNNIHGKRVNLGFFAHKHILCISCILLAKNNALLLLVNTPLNRRFDNVVLVQERCTVTLFWCRSAVL